MLPGYRDASGFGEAITVTQTYDRTSPDGHTTTTGTATFLYTRLRLADFGVQGNCVFSQLFELNFADFADTGYFLPIECNAGPAPGWGVLFLNPPAQPGAFEVRTIHPDAPDDVSHQDATCSLLASCAQAAPGRFVTSTSEYPFGGQVGTRLYSLYGDQVTDAVVNVELLQAPLAAVDNFPAVLPVYRVTVPTDVGLVGGSTHPFTLLINGTNAHVGEDDYLPFRFVAGSLARYGEVNLRARNVVDLVMKNSTDTLGGGTISYSKLVSEPPSQLAVSDLLVPIEEPFPMAGQSFSVPGTADGLTVTVDF